ncbi:MAG TPA: metal-sulfur cluster assembly factor [Pararhizobium sp.]|uniref:metal-sulfur cluster assembly factor n=1 Tax=Pararhizobium sp. TaxID=1977563 RepID=UPI002B75238F|nr:metal-sulfur cluster assembly factor [Pararhizobium sp.]HTO31433.1 metal-sulfur cluster assembly factor [Pararhizobium sp.]
MIAPQAIPDRIAIALSGVIDPEIGRSVVDIGLIYSADLTEDDHLLIRMTTTTRGCPATGFLVDAVRERAAAEGLARTVDVELTYDPPWSPDMMRGET